MSEMHDHTERTVDRAENGEQSPATRTGWTAPIWGAVTTVILTALAVPINFLALWMLVTGTQNYDSSGQGGPFRSCGPESTECSGGNPLVMLVSALVIFGVVAGIGYAGQAVGRHRSQLTGRAIMAGLSVVLTVVAAMLFWWIQVSEPHAAGSL